jgi:hypothetical protein
MKRRGVEFGRYFLFFSLAFAVFLYPRGDLVAKSLQDVIKYHFVRNANQLQQLIRSSVGGNLAILQYNGNSTEDTLSPSSARGMNLEKEFYKGLELLK